VTFGFGCGAYYDLPFEPGWLLVLAVLLAAIGLRLSFRRGTLVVVGTGALFCLAVGFAAAKVRTEWVRAPIIHASKKIRAVHGWVELIERKPEKGVRLTLRVSSIEGLSARATPFRIRVRSPYDNLDLSAGDAVVIQALLQPPPPPAWPGGFDFARHAWFQGVGGVGFAINRPVPDVSAPAMPIWLELTTAIERLREGVSARITAELPDPNGTVADSHITGER
jgi:competence protein ComEC